MFASTVDMSDEIALKNVGNRAPLLKSGEVAVYDTYVYRKTQPGN